MRLEQSIATLSLRKKKKIMREFDRGHGGAKEVDELLAKAAAMDDDDDDDDFDFGDSDFEDFDDDEDDDGDEEEEVSGACEVKTSSGSKSQSSGIRSAVDSVSCKLGGIDLQGGKASGSKVGTAGVDDDDDEGEDEDEEEDTNSG